MNINNTLYEIYSTSNKYFSKVEPLGMTNRTDYTIVFSESKTDKFPPIIVSINTKTLSENSISWEYSSDGTNSNKIAYFSNSIDNMVSVLNDIVRNKRIDSMYLENFLVTNLNENVDESVEIDANCVEDKDDCVYINIECFIETIESMCNSDEEDCIKIGSSSNEVISQFYRIKNMEESDNRVMVKFLIDEDYVSKLSINMKMKLNDFFETFDQIEDVYISDSEIKLMFNTKEKRAIVE